MPVLVKDSFGGEYVKLALSLARSSKKYSIVSDSSSVMSVSYTHLTLPTKRIV